MASWHEGAAGPVASAYCDALILGGVAPDKAIARRQKMIRTFAGMLAVDISVDTGIAASKPLLKAERIGS